MLTCVVLSISLYIDKVIEKLYSSFDAVTAMRWRKIKTITKGK